MWGAGHAWKLRLPNPVAQKIQDFADDSSTMADDGEGGADDRMADLYEVTLQLATIALRPVFPELDDDALSEISWDDSGATSFHAFGSDEDEHEEDQQ